MIDFLDVININGINYVEISEEAVPEIEPRKYYINIHGRVYDKERNIFLPQLFNSDTGYYSVSLKIRTKLYRHCLVHRLMMITFNYIPNYKVLQVDHINCIKTDNYMSNFEWVTLEENNRRANENGLILKGDDCPLVYIK